MKRAFRGYYSFTDEGFSKLWNECLFTVDVKYLQGHIGFPITQEMNSLKSYIMSVTAFGYLIKLLYSTMTTA